MKVPTICALHDPYSYCHALPGQFDAGLREGGHDNEIVDSVPDLRSRRPLLRDRGPLTLRRRPSVNRP